MYKVIGADQKEYGPVRVDQIRQWIVEGRVNAGTRLRAVTASDWVTAGELPEFRDALGMQAPRPPLPSPPGAGVQSLPVPTSGMAISSLILGILGPVTCGLSAIAGLVLGLISMSTIGKRPGAIRGRGIALAGVIVSSFFIVVGVIGTPALLLPALAKAKGRAEMVVCRNNARQLALAIWIYAGQNNNQLPPAQTWCDAIAPHVDSERFFQCPAGDRHQRSHFAFNERLGGMKADAVDPRAVLFFESDAGWNASGERNWS